MYSSFSGLPRVLLALLLVLRFPGEKATELPADQRGSAPVSLGSGDPRHPHPHPHLL